MPRICEVIVTTIDQAGRPHLAPLGLIEEGEKWIIAPFLPSTTHDNLAATSLAIANYTDDPRIFAGLVTGRRDWPLMSIPTSPVPRLAGALAHAELQVFQVEQHAERPRFHCKIAGKQQHAPFQGFNRAANAILECAILLTRLHILPREKIDREIAYLSIAVKKTAGPGEEEAWSWLMQKRDAFYEPK
ncbi:MAG TPA: DUF447 domain-containing protein [Methylocella sp.]|nr:DUF447 domain-containing protein [Methylocella sp.]